jgi:peptide/nickel transport system permease protein
VTNFILRRIALLPVILFGVTLLIFVMLSFLSPIQRLALYVQDVPMRDPLAIERLIEEHGLNDPIPQQYARWVGSLAGGNLGFSKTAGEPVSELIANRLPATVELALWAIVPIVVIGIWLGVYAALHHNGAPDQALRVFSIAGTSLPTFVAALLFLMFFAVYLGWLPTGGRLTPALQRVVDGPGWIGLTGLYTVDSLINARLDVFGDAVRHLILPVLTLAYISWATLLRVTRSSMLETLRQDYVTTARAKGLAEGTVVNRHARPNAMLPVVTIAGAELIVLLGGAVITETVFVWPGIGRSFVTAAQNLDVITVLGLVLLNGAILIVGNLVIDICYAWLDPRVRLA